MTAAAAVQTIIGGPHAPIGKGGKCGQEVPPPAECLSATSVLYLLCRVNMMPVSLLTERSTSQDVINKNRLRLANWSCAVTFDCES